MIDGLKQSIEKVNRLVEDPLNEEVVVDWCRYDVPCNIPRWHDQQIEFSVETSVATQKLLFDFDRVRERLKQLSLSFGYLCIRTSQRIGTAKRFGEVDHHHAKMGSE